jgi:hypothetical protein
MRKSFITLVFVLLLSFSFQQVNAQCSVCTRTAQQMGEKPAKGLNAGILYLAFTPLLLIGVIGFRWWKNNGARG